MDKLRAMEAYCRVVELKSFSAAAHSIFTAHGVD